MHVSFSLWGLPSLTKVVVVHVPVLQCGTLSMRTSTRIQRGDNGNDTFRRFQEVAWC